ncbi:unnamed protein product [Closterium sp. Yama58-4]|nr:unnamed protein product [Closterium sp. Yama58-4]
MTSFPPSAFQSSLALLSLLTLIALLRVCFEATQIALPRQAEAVYTDPPPPPIPEGCVAVAEADREAVRAVFAALPEGILFWDDGRSRLKMLDGHGNINATYCCVMPRPMLDESSWTHVSCPIECTPAGRVTRIYSDPRREDMPEPRGGGGSCPPGALSPAIGGLAGLLSLVFRLSCLAGNLPDSVTRLQKLTEIVMPENNFSGPIPPGLFRLPALRHVDLSTLNEFPESQSDMGPPTRPEGLVGLSGSLPDGPDAYSSSLETVILSGNALSGELPRALLRAPALLRLDLQSNNITGELPGEPGAYSRSITALILRNNSLSGAIPPALAEMAALRKLDLGENRLSGAVPAALLDSESLKALDEVRLDSNALTGPFCDALLPARELWLGFNDLGGATTGSSTSATGGSGGLGDAGLVGEADEAGSLHGCVLPAKLELLSAPHAGLRGSVPPDLFLATTAQSGHRPSVKAVNGIQMDLSHNSLSGSLKAFAVLLPESSTLDMSHNDFSGGIPEAFFTGGFSRADLQFNDLRDPLFDARLDSRSRFWVYEWDELRVSNNSARMAGAVGAGYLPAPAPGVQASAAETAALLAVRDALLREAAGGTAGRAGGATALTDGGISSRADILRSWDVSNSSACAWYGVGCTADGHVDTLHLIGASNVTLHPNFVPESAECKYDEESRVSSPLYASPGTLSPAACRRPSRASHTSSLSTSPPTATAAAAAAAAAGAGAAAPTTLSPGLESLDVGGNALSGSIPAAVSALTGLTRLALDHNRRATGARRALDAPRPAPAGERPPGGRLAAAFPSPAAAAADSAASSAPVLWGLSGVFPLLTRLDVSSNELLGDAATLSPLPQYLHTLNVSHNRLTCSPGNASWNAYHIDLSHNCISAPLQSLFSRDSLQFEVLRLSHNQLSGSIPAILNSYSIQTLDLSFNQLSGTIPELDGSLITCDLSHNRLTGIVPPANPEMEYPNVSWNQLDRIARWKDYEGTGLKSLDVSHNAMAGNLPDLGNSDGLMSLTYLDFSYNAFTGTLAQTTYPFLEQVTGSPGSVQSSPVPLGSLRQPALRLAATLARCSPPLTHLDLSRNKLKGSLPAFCQGKQRLASLLLSSNAFSGPLSSLLPSSSSCASSLLSLNFSTNQLSGSLPASLSHFTALHSLLATRNRMSGSIPAGLASLTALKELDVSWSGLSGTIPALLRATAPSLQVQLAGNAHSGAVPPSLSDLPTSCFRPGNPKLCGKPLPDCKKRSSKPRKGRV